MFEIDKEAFGKFVAEQRKAKGFTQKMLAEKLFVSDKAVSKWERALSMPDISLLIPLAEILDVSVTELLEGRKLEQDSEMDSEQVEILVKKALSFSEDTPEKNRERFKMHAMIFTGCTVIALLELFLSMFFLSGLGIDTLSSNLLPMEGMSFCFGIYFWFFMKDRLPVYYDENRIPFVSDGVFRMNMPGICFNNSNWPHIAQALRVWSVVTMITIPILCLLLPLLSASGMEHSSLFRWSFIIQTLTLTAYLAGLFVPVYVVGKKYE